LLVFDLADQASGHRLGFGAPQVLQDEPDHQGQRLDGHLPPNLRSYFRHRNAHTFGTPMAQVGFMDNRHLRGSPRDKG
jgi:hypothetical protein